MAKQCAFCSEPAVNKGGEHLWDNWINKKFPTERYLASRRLSHGALPIEYEADSLNEQLPVVCASCNSGWMSVLTDKVRLVFGRSMTDGEPLLLGPRDAALLACFTMMKAVVTFHMVEEYPFFTLAARERIRTACAVPSGTKMWVAAWQGTRRISTKSHVYVVSQSEPGGPLQGMKFFCFTYVVGQFVVQLLSPQWKSMYDMGKPLLSLNPNDYWSPAQLLFWPHAGGLLSWPPRKYLSDDTIQQFIYRFTEPVKVGVWS